MDRARVASWGRTSHTRPCLGLILKARCDWRTKTDVLV